MKFSLSFPKQSHDQLLGMDILVYMDTKRNSRTFEFPGGSDLCLPSLSIMATYNSPQSWQLLQNKIVNDMGFRKEETLAISMFYKSGGNLFEYGYS